MEILNRVKDPIAREYYIRATRKFGWSKNVLIHNIEGKAFERFALYETHNFDQTLPKKLQDQAKLALKDHYVFDFLEMGKDYRERELEGDLVRHMQEFILELGLGEFTFVGRQFRITVDEDDYFVDLLFYHRTLHCLFAFELKVGKFEPEYVGKMNFYLAALDSLVKKPEENPSIGIILCKEKKKHTVEYAFSNISTPMGVSTYDKIKQLPKKYQGILPSPDILQKEMETCEQKHTNFIPSLQKFPPQSRGASRFPSLNMRQKRFLSVAKVGDRITSKEYAKKMKISSASGLRDLKDLTAKEFLKRFGTRRNTHFQVVKSLYAPSLEDFEVREKFRICYSALTMSSNFI